MTFEKEIEGIRSRKACLAAVLLILFIIVLRNITDGTKVYNGYNPDYPANVFSDNNILENEKVTLSGKVVSIDKKETSIGTLTTILVKSVRFYDVKMWNYKNIRDENGIQVTFGNEKISISTYDEVDLRHNQKILFQGKLKYFARATNWGEFDYYNFYRNKSVLCNIELTNIISKSQKYNWLFYKLWLLKGDISNDIEYLYEEDDASILKAMLLGAKNDISLEIKTAFQKSGIAHILAISGLHISFLCMFFYKLLNKIGLDIVLCAALSEIILILYVIMIGFSPSACRAAVMFSVYIASVVLKRSYDLLSALGIALIIISSFNKWAIYDFSVVLSFLAVLAIGLFVKRLINNDIYLIKILRNRDSSRLLGRLYNLVIVKTGRNLIATIVVGLVTLPAILYSYYEITMYSWLLNLVLVPLMPVLLVAAILSLIMTKTVKILGCVFRMITCVILEIYKKSCIFLEKTGFGRRNIGKPTIFQITLYIVLLTVVLVLAWKRYHMLRFAIFLAGMMILVTRNDYGLYMLDVGQGDCFFVIDQSNRAYMFDGGSTSKKGVGKNIIIPFLKSRGINRIEAIYASHPDEDHINGIIEVLEKGQDECLEVGRVVVGANNLQNSGFESINTLAEDNDIEVIGMEQGDIHRGDNIEIRCLYPSSDIEVNDNNGSLVLEICTNGFSFVETGDLEMEGEQILLSSGCLKAADVLKVGHHGSSGSSGKEFLDTVNPQIAIVSAGKNNKYGHPHEETMDRIEKAKASAFVTSECGAVHIRKKKSKYLIDRYK